MTDPQAPPSKIYLATPPQIDLSQFRDHLAAIFQTTPIACLRLSLTTRDEDALARAGDVLRDLSHAHDVPVVIDDHYRLVARIGLDGVHLTDGARRVRDVRKALGAEAIIGAFCGTSKHGGLTAGEAGADYISFGPVTNDSLLGDDTTVAPALFDWWAEMIELPVVAEGGIVADALAQVAAADFLCLGAEIWDHPQGAQHALAEIHQQLAAAPQRPPAGAPPQTADP